MELYYSAKTGGFYDSRIHQTLPNDAVKISAKTHQALLGDNAQGARIEADAQGYPHAVFPSKAQVLAQVKAAALSRLTHLIRSQYQQAMGANDDSEITICLHRYRTALAIQNGTATPEEQAAFAKEIEARALNESLENLCADILEQGARLIKTIGITEGLKHRITQAINQANTQTEIEALEQDFKAHLIDLSH